MPPSSRPLSLSFCFLFSNSVLVFDTTGQLIYTHQKQCHHCENGQKAKGASKTPLSLPIHPSLHQIYHTSSLSILPSHHPFADKISLLPSLYNICLTRRDIYIYIDSIHTNTLYKMLQNCTRNYGRPN